MPTTKSRRTKSKRAARYPDYELDSDGDIVQTHRTRRARGRWAVNSKASKRERKKKLAAEKLTASQVADEDSDDDLDAAASQVSSEDPEQAPGHYSSHSNSEEQEGNEQHGATAAAIPQPYSSGNIPSRGLQVNTSDEADSEDDEVITLTF
jgi:hypothetical protein